MSGYHFPNGVRSNGLSLALDANDNVSWAGQYGTSYIEIIEGIVPTNDGGFMMAGFADPDSIIISPSENGLFPWLVKTNSSGEPDCHHAPMNISMQDTSLSTSAYQLSEAAGPALNDIDFISFALETPLDSVLCQAASIQRLPKASFRIYPNPSRGVITLELEHPFPASQIIISDALGRSVLRSSLQHQSQLSLAIEAPAGLYYLTLLTPSGERLTQKLVLE